MPITTVHHSNCTTHTDGELEIKIDPNSPVFLLNMTDDQGKVDQWFVTVSQAYRLVELLKKVAN